MKLSDLKEMAAKAGSYENLEKWTYEFSKLKETGEHVGDIEKYEVYRKNRDRVTDYSLFLNNDIVAYFEIENPTTLDVAYVKKEHRQKGLFSAFLFFLKRNERMSKIILGNLHSQDTINAVKKIYTRFDTYWWNGKEKISFDPEKTDYPFYNHKNPKEWKLILENDTDFYDDWPKFYNLKEAFNNGDMLKIWYFGFLGLTDD